MKMQTGVILLIPSASEETERLTAKLQLKGIPVLECTQDDAGDEPESIMDFIADNELEAVVVSNDSQAPPPASLRHAIEEARLGRHAVSWIDFTLFSEERPSKDNLNATNMTVLVNVARLQHAYLAKNAVLRMAASSSEISRRDLFRSIPRVLRVESDIPIVLADLCEDHSKSCKYCASACPVNAISEAARGVTINERLCIECGACARECPIGAIQSPSVSDAQLTAMLNTIATEELEPNKRALVLTCHIGFERLLNERRKGKRLGSGVVPVQIPCVSSIGSVHHLWATSLGVTLLTVCPDISCNRAVAMFPLYRHAASSNSILKALGRDGKTLVYHLGLGANDSIVDIVSQAVASTSAVGVSATLSGSSRREVMVDVIIKLRTGNGDTELPESSTLPLFDLKVEDARCTFCESCQTDCPDHAIEFTKSEDTVTLMFKPSLCAGCVTCEVNCPEKAIAVSRLKDFSAILERKNATRVQDENAKCENCGVTLGSKRNLAHLRKRLSEQGVSDPTLRALSLCIRCKQEALIRPLGSTCRSNLGARHCSLN